MSLLSWLKGEQTPNPLLPDGPDTTTSAANENVGAGIARQDCGRCKQGKYHHYTAEIRVKIAEYVTEQRNTAAVMKFSVG